MLSTLKYIVQSNWSRRNQIFHLAKAEVGKSTRGTALGILWLLIKPAVYVSVFWFALAIGLRGERNVGDYPYILWLMSGLIPWFFMQSMISSGANVYSKFPYLVNRIPFDMPCISTIFTVSQFMVNCLLMCFVLGMAFITGYGLSIYAIQLPFVMLIGLLFWTFYSMMVSPLCAIAKDFSMFIKVLSTPVFWASGVIFNLDKIDYPIIRSILAWDPVTVLVTGYRAALCDRYWIWERPELLIPFVAVFVLTAFFAVLSQKFLSKEVSDAL